MRSLYSKVRMMLAAMLRAASRPVAASLLALSSMANMAHATLITLVFVDSEGASNVQFLPGADAPGPSFTIADGTYTPTSAHVLGFCHDEGARCSAFDGKYSLALTDPIDGSLEDLVTVSWATLSSTTSSFELHYYANPADADPLGEILGDFPLLAWKTHSASQYCDPLNDPTCTMSSEFVFRFDTGVFGIVHPTESVPEPGSVGLSMLALAAVVAAARRSRGLAPAKSARQG